jgi:hypothetical protein
MVPDTHRNAVGQAFERHCSVISGPRMIAECWFVFQALALARAYGLLFCERLLSTDKQFGCDAA